MLSDRGKILLANPDCAMSKFWDGDAWKVQQVFVEDGEVDIEFFESSVEARPLAEGLTRKRQPKDTSVCNCNGKERPEDLNNITGARKAKKQEPRTAGASAAGALQAEVDARSPQNYSNFAIICSKKGTDGSLWYRA